MKFIKRYWHHAWKLRNNQHDNKHMQRTWNKSSEDSFTFEVIHIVDKKEDMNELEVEYIKKYNSYKKGFNMTTGGEGKKNCVMPEKAKKIVGEKNRMHNLGKKHSEKTKVKMRESSPRRKLTDEQKEALLKSRLDTPTSDATRRKLRESHLGSNNSVSKINEGIAKEIKLGLIAGDRPVDISKQLNVGDRIVRSILSNKVWTHVHVDGWNEYVNHYNSTKKKRCDSETVNKIRELLKKGHTTTEISKVLDIGVSVVYGIKQNRNYKYI